MKAMALQRSLFFSAAVVALLLVFFGVNFSLQTQLIVLTFFVVLAGLPHGTLDPWIAQQKGLWKQPMGLLLFILCYLGCVAITVILWSLFPGTSLLVFLLISAWHFGQDWQTDFSPAACLAAGFMVITAPVVFHAEMVASLFQQIGTPQSAATATQAAWLLLPVAGITVVFECLKNFKNLPASHSLLELMLLMVLAALLAPLLYFLVYFCFQHSPRHMIRHSQSMRFKFILINALILTAASAVIGVFGFMTLEHLNFSERMLNVLFVGLAALTVPHMLLIDFSTIFGATDE